MESRAFDKLLFDVKGFNRKVLVVEDDSDCSFIMQKTLESCSKQIGEDLEVSAVQSFHEAVDQTKQSNFDIIICDIKLLGHESGIEFYEYCRKQKISCIFIFVSGTESEKYYEHFVGDTARWPIYIHKPIKPSSLSHCINEEIKRKTNGNYPA